MWKPVPDHSAINRFRKERLRAAPEGVFCRLAEKLSELGEDGTKDRREREPIYVCQEAKMPVKVQELTENAVRKETVNEDMEKTAALVEGKKA